MPGEMCTAFHCKYIQIKMQISKITLSTFITETEKMLTDFYNEKKTEV